MQSKSTDAALLIPRKRSKALWVEDKAQWVTCLLCNREDLSLASQQHHALVTLGTGGSETVWDWTLGSSFWPADLAELVSFRCRESACLERNKVERVANTCMFGIYVELQYTQKHTLAHTSARVCAQEKQSMWKTQTSVNFPQMRVSCIVYLTQWQLLPPIQCC